MKQIANPLARDCLRVLGICGMAFVLFGLWASGGIGGFHGRDGHIFFSVMLFFFAASLGCLWLGRKTKDEKAAAKKIREAERNEAFAQRERESRIITGDYGTGLVGLKENTPCDLFFDDDGLLISSGGIRYQLSYEKIVSMAVVTDEDIQKYYVSSVGGAAAGYAIFGALGAWYFGRSKEVKSVIYTHYLVISYQKEGTPDCIVLCLSEDKGKKDKAEGLINRFQEKFCKEQVIIEL